MEKKDIRAYTYEQLQEEMKGIGEKAFRGKQIYEWLHVRLADSFDEMTNLSKALRESWKRSMRSFPWNWQPDRSRNWTGRTNSCSVSGTEIWWKVC